MMDINTSKQKRDSVKKNYDLILVSKDKEKLQNEYDSFLEKIKLIQL